jgi:hypothetical protein
VVPIFLFRFQRPEARAEHSIRLPAWHVRVPHHYDYFAIDRLPVASSSLARILLTRTIGVGRFCHACIDDVQDGAAENSCLSEMGHANRADDRRAGWQLSIG